MIKLISAISVLLIGVSSLASMKVGDSATYDMRIASFGHVQDSKVVFKVTQVMPDGAYVYESVTSSNGQVTASGSYTIDGNTSHQQEATIKKALVECRDSGGQFQEISINGKVVGTCTVKEFQNGVDVVMTVADVPFYLVVMSTKDGTYEYTMTLTDFIKQP